VRQCKPVLEAINSGGQTGVDRAALDAARLHGLACGGWCPRGRIAEDGTLPERYPLRETPSAAYGQRTQWNVRDADGTLILHRDGLAGGTLLTARYARSMGKPLLFIDLDQGVPVQQVVAWIERYAIRTLNIAGPRESQCPGIYAAALRYLRGLLRLVGPAPAPPPAG
jgi:hypothetical protein